LTNTDHQPEDLHDRRFQGGPDRLRAPDRVELLEVPRVIALSMEGLTVKNLLDVGTGTGIFAEAFAALGIDITGIDVNVELLAIAQQHIPSGKFREGPMEKLPFPDRSFDLVFLGHVLHEADNFLTALQEARRVARNRVAILEWPYREEQKGPPLEHRLKSSVVEDFATKAGYTQIETQHLQHMDFYRLTPR
jgi:ubiquinone/menaquinone biosynthesis C-methylase UbiE